MVLVPPAHADIRFVVRAEDNGTRLDKILAHNAPEISRARLQALVKAGACQAARNATTDTIKDPAWRVKPDDEIVLRVPPPQETRVAGQAMPLDILHEDAHLIVLNKPAGLVVHPAPGNRDKTLVNALIAHCGDTLSGIGGEKRPGIVHRLDKDTSGVMVAAKTDAAHLSLSEQFAAHGRDGRMRRIWRLKPPRGISMYVGSQWFIISKAFATYLKDDRHFVPRYIDYGRHTMVADENFFATVIKNSPFCHTQRRLVSSRAPTCAAHSQPYNHLGTFTHADGSLRLAAGHRHRAERRVPFGGARSWRGATRGHGDDGAGPALQPDGLRLVRRPRDRVRRAREMRVLRVGHGCVALVAHRG